MKKGASIMSDESQQMADLLLVIELVEASLSAHRQGEIKDEPSSFRPSL